MDWINTYQKKFVIKNWRNPNLVQKEVEKIVGNK
jgi:hypothetical protein